MTNKNTTVGVQPQHPNSGLSSLIYVETLEAHHLKPFVPLNGALVRFSGFSVKLLNCPGRQRDVFYSIDNHRVEQNETCSLTISDTFSWLELKNSTHGTGRDIRALLDLRSKGVKKNRKKKPGHFIDLDRMSQKWTAFDVPSLPAEFPSFPSFLWSMVLIINICMFFFFCSSFLYAAYVQSIWLAQS